MIYLRKAETTVTEYAQRDKIALDGKGHNEFLSNVQG